MIEIKSNFGGWRKVTVEQAKRYIIYLKHAMVNISERGRDAYINKNHLRGVTVNMLWEM